MLICFMNAMTTMLIADETRLADFLHLRKTRVSGKGVCANPLKFSTMPFFMLAYNQTTENARTIMGGCWLASEMTFSLFIIIALL